MKIKNLIDQICSYSDTYKFKYFTDDDIKRRLIELHSILVDLTKEPLTDPVVMFEYLMSNKNLYEVLNIEDVIYQEAQKQFDKPMVKKTLIEMYKKLDLGVDGFLFKMNKETLYKLMSLNEFRNIKISKLV
jgi:hypothetical protein